VKAKTKPLKNPPPSCKPSDESGVKGRERHLKTKRISCRAKQVLPQISKNLAAIGKKKTGGGKRLVSPAIRNSLYFKIQRENTRRGHRNGSNTRGFLSEIHSRKEMYYLSTQKLTQFLYRVWCDKGRERNNHGRKEIE